MQLKFEILRIPFKVSFKHASAERKVTSTVWITAQKDDKIGYGESCPRPYVTGETEESCRLFFEQFQMDLEKLDSLSEMIDWKNRNAELLSNNLAAWCGVELALLNLFAQELEISVESLLGVHDLQGTYQYTAVIGDAPFETWKQLFDWHFQKKMLDFKLKMSGDVEKDREKICYIQKRYKGIGDVRIRLDLNNFFSDSKTFLNYCKELDVSVFAIEEPLVFPNYQALNQLAEEIEPMIILDEHLYRLDQLDQINGGDKMLVNVRVSKCGGILNSIALAKAAKDKGLGVIVGAQVGETSLLTLSALTVVQALGGYVVAQEGGYGSNLLESDPLGHFVEYGDWGRLVIL
jgi:L-alanine-DL-glutamate epimerase-like enolase superfamily enzyme